MDFNWKHVFTSGISFVIAYALPLYIVEKILPLIVIITLVIPTVMIIQWFDKRKKNKEEEDK